MTWLAPWYHMTSLRVAMRPNRRTLAFGMSMVALPRCLTIFQSVINSSGQLPMDQPRGPLACGQSLDLLAVAVMVTLSAGVWETGTVLDLPLVLLRLGAACMPGRVALDHVPFLKYQDSDSMSSFQSADQEILGRFAPLKNDFFQ
ncbi:hypothetical protein B0H11DRAFT_1920844 [Mycena galericulata]|nr:hypothetical protein B0H11DRAFT_1920844 [Mycena galericulata]